MPSVSDIYYFSHQEEKNIRPPVILIHGAGGNHLSWPPQIRRLPGKSIHALDLPGHGKSTGMGRHSIAEYAEDLAAFMKALKMRNAVLVGISMGSGIALALALKYPDKVSGLVLLGAGPKLRVASKILESLGNPNLFESAVNLINENCFSAKTSQRLKDLSKRTMLEMRPPVLLGDFIACDQFDVSGRLQEIKIPTLVVCGAEDKMTPLKYSESLRDAIAGSQLEVLKDAGHMLMVEQPQAMADILVKFINTLPPRACRRTRLRSAR